jgi:membrane protein DedA with SNARE-associated domain
MHILASGSPAPLPGFLSAVSGPLDHYGYWAIALLLLLENIGVPVVPGEFALIAGAILAGSGQAGLNIALVGVVALAAAFTGSEVGYLIGRFAGRGLVLRYGKYVLLTPHHLERAEAIGSRFGGLVVVIARFIVGLREANGIIAGVTQMRWLTFMIFNAIGACAWVAIWLTVGDLAGGHIDAIYADVNRFSLYVFIVLAVAGAGYVVRWAVRRRHRLRAEARIRREGAAAAAEPGPDPEPAASDQPAPDPEPAASDQPAPDPEPAASDQPGPDPEPAASDQPGPDPEPAASDQPAPDPEPAASDQPGPDPEPAASDQPGPGTREPQEPHVPQNAQEPQEPQHPRGTQQR